MFRGNIRAWEQPYSLSARAAVWLTDASGCTQETVCFYLPADNRDWHHHLCESFRLKAAPQRLAPGRIPQAWIWDCGAGCLFVN